MAGRLAPGASYQPSAEERQLYDRLWVMATQQTSPAAALQGATAFHFFLQSGLPQQTLKVVWDIADSKQQHFLNLNHFYTAMRLISLAQANFPVTADTLTGTLGARLPLPSPWGAAAAQFVQAVTPDAEDAFGDFVDAQPSKSQPTRPAGINTSQSSFGGLAAAENAVQSPVMGVSLHRRHDSMPTIGSPHVQHKQKPSDEEFGAFTVAAEKKEEEFGDFEGAATSGAPAADPFEASVVSHTVSDSVINPFADAAETASSTDDPLGPSTDDPFTSSTDDPFSTVSDLPRHRLSDDPFAAAAAADDATVVVESEPTLGHVPVDIDDAFGALVDTPKKAPVGNDEEVVEASTENCCDLESLTEESDGLDWSMPQEMQNQLKSWFDGIAVDGYVSEEAGAKFFAQSGLPHETIKSLFDMADVSKDGRLTEAEFSVGFHIALCITRKQYPLPSKLPSVLLHVVESELGKPTSNNDKEMDADNFGDFATADEEHQNLPKGVSSQDKAASIMSLFGKAPEPPPAAETADDIDEDFGDFTNASFPADGPSMEAVDLQATSNAEVTDKDSEDFGDFEAAAGISHDGDDDKDIGFGDFEGAGGPSTTEHREVSNGNEVENTFGDFESAHSPAPMTTGKVDSPESASNGGPTDSILAGPSTTPELGTDKPTIPGDDPFAALDHFQPVQSQVVEPTLDSFDESSVNVKPSPEHDKVDPEVEALPDDAPLLLVLASLLRAELFDDALLCVGQLVTETLIEEQVARKGDAVAEERFEDAAAAKKMVKDLETKLLSAEAIKALRAAPSEKMCTNRTFREVLAILAESSPASAVDEGAEVLFLRLHSPQEFAFQRDELIQSMTLSDFSPSTASASISALRAKHHAAMRAVDITLELIKEDTSHASASPAKMTLCSQWIELLNVVNKESETATALLGELAKSTDSVAAAEVLASKALREYVRGLASMHDVATCISCAAEGALPLETLGPLRSALATARDSRAAFVVGVEKSGMIIPDMLQGEVVRRAFDNIAFNTRERHELCALCRVPVKGLDVTVFHVKSSPFVANAVNLWVNRISTTLPESI